jgi:iron(III) transport system permease protein
MTNMVSPRARLATWGVGLLLVLCALPILTIAALAFSSAPSGWAHMVAQVLPPLVWTTVLLCLGSAVLTLAIGGTSAWLVAMYDFPGRSVLKWMLLLPLAMPGYIISFLYVDALTFAGPVQTYLRQIFGWSSPADYWFPDIRSVGGAVVVLSFALYPYVYMAGWAAFVRQPMNQWHVARTLGRKPLRAFLDVCLPPARPALLIGAFLVITECLNDIGAATFFGLRTLTIAVYSTWLDDGNLAGAAQLALMLLTGLGVVLFVENMLRRSAALARSAHATPTAQPQILTGASGWLATVALVLPVLAGFVAPVALLLAHGAHRFDEVFTVDFLNALKNSVFLALLASAATVLIALALTFANRASPSTTRSALTKVASLGYALPGTVLGLGILVPFGQLDQLINVGSEYYLNWRIGLVVSGGVFAVLFAYVTRFLIIAVGNIEDGMTKIPVNIDHVARTLGRSNLQNFFAIHLPLLRPSLIAATLLVFVDAMKELPATLILRPFDFETLSTRVFTLSSLGQFESAALPALAIVLAGLLPVIILARALRDGGRHQSAAG